MNELMASQDEPSGFLGHSSSASTHLSANCDRMASVKMRAGAGACSFHSLYPGRLELASVSCTGQERQSTLADLSWAPAGAEGLGWSHAGGGSAGTEV